MIGANGTIGSRLAQLMSARFELSTLSRADTDYSEKSLKEVERDLSQKGAFELIVCCIGTLHNEVVAPEKKLADLDKAKLLEYFRVNTIIPSLCLKHFHGLLNKHEPSRFVFLSAMVGSIEDNRLGGWYGYRSSKAALNQMIKTASVEVRRKNKNACLALIHPGTTIGPLSKPFSSRIADNKIYNPEQSAERILNVAMSLEPQQTGSFFNWDGRIIPW